VLGCQNRADFLNRLAPNAHHKNWRGATNVMYTLLEYAIILALVMALAAFVFLVYTLILTLEAAGRFAALFTRRAYASLLHTYLVVLKLTRSAAALPTQESQ
jgi:hypothetical protein